jgi:predicted ArsR family transcriptional regulator
MKSKLILNADTREEIFLDLIHELWKYSDEGLREIAEQAGCHWGTLYNWKAGKTMAPRIDKLAPVARVLGYNVTLTKIKAPVPKHLRSVK